MLLGVETDTYDITGKIVFANTLNEDEIYIKERIKRFIGKVLKYHQFIVLLRLKVKSI